MNVQPRVRPITPGTRPELATLEEEIRAQRYGEIPVLYQVLLNSAPVASGWEKLLTAVRKLGIVPSDLREMIILRVAVLNGASFEFEAHLPHARTAGVGEDKLEALARVPMPQNPFNELENLVLQVTDHMTRDVKVPSDLMDQLMSNFGEREALEIVVTIAAYNMVSRLLVALDILH